MQKLSKLTDKNVLKAATCDNSDVNNRIIRQIANMQKIDLSDFPSSFIALTSWAIKN